MCLSGCLRVGVQECVCGWMRNVEWCENSFKEELLCYQRDELGWKSGSRLGFRRVEFIIVCAFSKLLRDNFHRAFSISLFIHFWRGRKILVDADSPLFKLNDKIHHFPTLIKFHIKILGFRLLAQRKIKKLFRENDDAMTFTRSEVHQTSASASSWIL